MKMKKVAESTTSDENLLDTVAKQVEKPVESSPNQKQSAEKVAVSQKP